MFLYTNNEQSKKEIKKIIQLTKASKKIKYQRINLTKKVKDLYTEIKNKMQKENKENLNKWKDILCSWKHNMKWKT